METLSSFCDWENINSKAKAKAKAMADITIELINGTVKESISEKKVF